MIFFCIFQNPFIIVAGEPGQPFVPLQSDGWALWDQEKYQQKYFLHHRDQHLSSNFSSKKRSTSEFKFSPNLYKINCTWSMESFYVGSETDIFSLDFEWFNFLTITGQICIKHKKLERPFKSIKTKLAVIDKARKCWFDCWQYKLRQMRCTTGKNWSLELLKSWSVEMFS